MAETITKVEYDEMVAKKWTALNDALAASQAREQRLAEYAKYATELMENFTYEADEDSCMGMSFFKARISEDWFFHVKWKLEALVAEYESTRGEQG